MAYPYCDTCGRWNVECNCGYDDPPLNFNKPLKQDNKLKKDNVKKLSNQEIINIISKRSKKDKEFIMKNL